MSQPSSDLDLDEFAAPTESTYDAEGAAPAPEPVVPRYRKQEFSIYTIMLILSFAFLTTALILMFVEAGKYN